MKKKKFADGGEFELSPEALAAGLRMGRNERISDEDRAAAIEETAGSKGFKRLTDKEAADMMGREVNMPEAVSIPVPRPRATSGRSMPDMVSDQISRNVPTPRLGNQNDYSMNEQEGSGGSRAPSRGDYSRNGPIGDAKNAIGDFLRNLPHNRQLRKERLEREALNASPFKRGGAVKKMAKGGSVSPASKRADGCCVKGKTKGAMR